MIEIRSPLKLALIFIGWISLALGFLGVFLPLLPTTPFVLLAAYCFSKSSPKLHQWLMNQPRLGPLIQNWEQYGSISKQAKVMATVCMAIVFPMSLFVMGIGLLWKGILGLLAGGVVWFIWSRPLPPSGFPGYPIEELARIDPPFIR